MKRRPEVGSPRRPFVARMNHAWRRSLRSLRHHRSQAVAQASNARHTLLEQGRGWVAFARYVREVELPQEAPQVSHHPWRELLRELER